MRETWYERFDGLDDCRFDGYVADGEKPVGKVAATAFEAITSGARGKRPSIFMKREDSRINLEIIRVRIERLQEITDEDAIAEGVEAMPLSYEETGEGLARQCFENLWNSINKDRGFGWEQNPCVFVISFKVMP